MTIMMAIGIVSPESSIVLVAIEVATIDFVEVTSMPVRTSISTSFRGVVPLVERFSVSLATVEFPLTIFLLLYVIV
jgi:hypothetical protein